MLIVSVSYTTVREGIFIDYENVHTIIIIAANCFFPGRLTIKCCSNNGDAMAKLKQVGGDIQCVCFRSIKVLRKKAMDKDSDPHELGIDADIEEYRSE